MGSAILALICIWSWATQSGAIISKDCPSAKMEFEVLPGGGFDNLRNVEMGRILAVSYNNCRVSEDGRYLLPDDLWLTPVKQSNVKFSAELIEHYGDYKSATSSSINADVSVYSFASGSFSSEHETIKEHQVADKAATTRVQIRYHLYTARIQPDSELDGAFKRRLMEVAEALLSNRTRQASYLADLIIRDFGTHVVTSSEAGASLVRFEQLKSSFVDDSAPDKSRIKAQAGGNFLGMLGWSIGYTKSTDESFREAYSKSVTNSEIVSYGGPTLKATFSLDEWEAGVYNDLVAIDRDGDPIYYVITTRSMPEVPEPTVREVGVLVKSSLDRYYRVNTVRGCMQMDSPNFNYQANIDEPESCVARLTNFTFGGIFTICQMQQDFFRRQDFCPEIAQKNPLTGYFSCRDGYTAVEFIGGTAQKTEQHRECSCYSCGFLWLSDCCDDCSDVYYTSYAQYTGYWCAAIGHVEQNSGLLFGGLYTATRANPITKERSCPTNFLSLRLGRETMVCVSDDYELGYRYSLPFAGFFNCRVGNPLASLPQTLENGKPVRKDSLASFVNAVGGSNWLRKCPPGFAQHLASVENDCEIQYCVRVNSFSGQNLLAIRRPPFTDEPSMSANLITTLQIIDPSQRSWTRLNASEDWVLKSSRGGAVDAKANGGLIAVFTILSTLILGLFVAVAVLSLKARDRKRRMIDGSHSSLITSRDGNGARSYGALVNEERATNGNEEEVTNGIVNEAGCA